MTVYVQHNFAHTTIRVIFHTYVAVNSGGFHVL